MVQKASKETARGQQKNNEALSLAVVLAGYIDSGPLCPLFEDVKRLIPEKTNYYNYGLHNLDVRKE